jgi:rare lipoprotein A
MKVFTAILLFCFFLRTDAQTKFIQANYKNSSDSAIIADNTTPTPASPVSTVAVSIKPLNTATKASNVKFGIASFYSKNLEGTETATGEIFSHKKFTAASNNYKLNTWVRVTNLSTGKSVIVRINDRMHPRMAAKGRVVDLSIAAATKIGLTKGIGITKVMVEEVPKGTME